MHKERRKSAPDNFKEYQKRIYNGQAKEGAVGFGGLDFYEFNRRCYDVPIHLKDVKTQKLIRELRIASGSTILDVGCRYGDLLTRLNLVYGTSGVGIDISIESLRIASGHQLEANKYCGADADQLPFSDQSFDFVVSFDVLEHLPSPDRCIAEISRVLKAGGKVLIYAISKNNKYTWHWFLQKISLGRLGKDSGGFGDHFEDHFIDPRDLSKEMMRNKLKTERLVCFHSFFTLMFDEIIPKIMWHLIKRLSRLKISQCTGKQNNFRLPFALGLYSLLVVLFSPLFEILDKPISSQGYSNGFYILAKKT